MSFFSGPDPIAPRYVLSQSDHRVLRYVHPGRKNYKLATEIYDLSYSGVSFYASHRLAPEVGDTLSLEFIIPNKRQIACFGKVVRVEKVRSYRLTSEANSHRIGVRFVSLPNTYKDWLETSVAEALVGMPVVQPVNSSAWGGYSFDLPQIELPKLGRGVTVLLASIAVAAGSQFMIKYLKDSVERNQKDGYFNFPTNRK